ncbi:MAG: nicotinamide-nucleotide adenylyltransferase [Candidatus Thermoplasmatota archaeon]|jgi:nicotinamide-nucleotide adenylyltransferase|nr:nicotinamide-nucleotide adenylyltransferase [Candidatus Thermoplasmatota archaeon]MDP7264322.1 nicotinamide-nucleotide adenylyltransferase [Candidatus Thermoplasmatota archaeon]
MLKLKEIFGWTARKYGVRIRNFIKIATKDILDNEERRKIIFRFKNIDTEDIPQALSKTWDDVKNGKYVSYFKQNRARKKFIKGFNNGAHRLIKLTALVTVLWTLFLPATNKTFGISVFAFLFILWSIEDLLFMIFSFRKSRKMYSLGTDPPEKKFEGRWGRLNFSYIFGTILYLTGLLSVFFLIPPLSDPLDIQRKYGTYSWPVIYIFVIVLWLMAVKAVINAFKYSHSLGRRIALLKHDRKIMKRIKKENKLNKYGKALTKYVYLPVILTALFVIISVGFKYLYMILMNALKKDNFTMIDSLGTGLMNLLSGGKTAALPEWIPRIKGGWLVGFQLSCIILLGIGTYLRNRKINSVLRPNTPQSPAGKKVNMLIQDLTFIKKKKIRKTGRKFHSTTSREVEKVDKKRRGLYIGRFQPFHKGHYKVIGEIIDELEYLIIGIGSAKASYTEKNPFSCGERISMIRNSLKPSWREKCILIPIDDINRYNVWVSHVEDLAPPFDLVVGNSALTALLFSDKGYYIKKPKEYSRNEYKGELIRRKMREGNEWRGSVPEETASVIDGINGVERIKNIENH